MDEDRIATRHRGLTIGAAAAAVLLASAPAHAALHDYAGSVISPMNNPGPEDTSFITPYDDQYGYVSANQSRMIEGGQTLNYTYDDSAMTVKIPEQLLKVYAVDGNYDKYNGTGTIGGGYVAIKIGTNGMDTLNIGPTGTAPFTTEAEYTSPNGTQITNHVIGNLGLEVVWDPDGDFSTTSGQVSFDGTLAFTYNDLSDDLLGDTSYDSQDLISGFGADANGSMLMLLGGTLERMCHWDTNGYPDPNDCNTDGSNLSMIGPTNTAGDTAWYQQILAENLFYYNGYDYSACYGGVNSAPDGCLHYYKKQRIELRLAAYSTNETPPGDDNPVPEPASLSLLGLGLAGIRLIRRRNARKA